jgi:hypothetical protein
LIKSINAILYRSRDDEILSKYEFPAGVKEKPSEYPDMQQHKAFEETIGK